MEAARHPFFDGMYVYFALGVEMQHAHFLGFRIWAGMTTHEGPRKADWMPSVLRVHPSATIDKTILACHKFYGQFIPSNNDLQFSMPKTSPSIRPRPDVLAEQLSPSVRLCGKPVRTLDNVPSRIALCAQGQWRLDFANAGLKMPDNDQPSKHKYSDSDASLSTVDLNSPTAASDTSKQLDVLEAGLLSPAGPAKEVDA